MNNTNNNPKSLSNFSNDAVDGKNVMEIQLEWAQSVATQ